MRCLHPQNVLSGSNDDKANIDMTLYHPSQLDMINLFMVIMLMLHEQK